MFQEDLERALFKKLATDLDDFRGQLLPRAQIHGQRILNDVAEIRDRVDAAIRRFVKLQLVVGVRKQDDALANTGLELLRGLGNGRSHGDTTLDPWQVGARGEDLVALEIVERVPVKRGQQTVVSKPALGEELLVVALSIRLAFLLS